MNRFWKTKKEIITQREEKKKDATLTHDVLALERKLDRS